MRGIACRRVEIDHGVVGAARADPLIECLPLGLALLREVRGALERRQRAAVDGDTSRVRALDQLLVGGDEIGAGSLRPDRRLMKQACKRERKNNGAGNGGFQCGPPGTCAARQPRTKPGV
jgi:hypothetical protein